MLAVRGDEEEVAALLLRHGADVTHTDFNGHNVVINAAANNQVGAITKLSRKVDHLSIVPARKGVSVSRRRVAATMPHST